MEMLLIEVAIGLLVIYAAMALLLTRVQEGLHGGVMRARVSNLHELLLQACGNDKTLKERVLANPLLLALSKRDSARPSGWFSRASGPSAVPPDTFVRALLMELNPSGKAPATEALSPLAFMDSIMKGVKESDPRHAYLNGLRALIPAADSNWPAFESALALWFSDIGDRASGWYKRSSSVMGLWIAVGLCFVMNVDTHNIVNSLGADSELRQSLGPLVDLVLQTREGQDKTPAELAAQQSKAPDPATQAVARLVDANARISEAYYKDKAIARFGYYVSKASEVCAGVPQAGSAVREEGTYVSNADTWVGLLPALLPAIEKAVNRIDEGADVPATLRASYSCLSHISAWVRAASTASNNADTRRVMLEAGVALEESKSALVQLLRGSESQGGLRRLFKRDPEAFARCAARANASSAGMQACVMGEQDLLSRLPLGHTSANHRQQFCEVRTQDDGALVARPAAEPLPVAITAASAAVVSVAIQPVLKDVPHPQVSTDTRSRLSSLLCGDVVLSAQPRLGMGGMTLVFDPLALLSFPLGLLISALFISLGAPILFDTLALWVKVRNAGSVRDASKDALKGAGTMSLPKLAAGGSAAVVASTPSTVSDTRPGPLAANEGAVGDFEEQLTARELQSVKQRLGIQPSTGGFDADTRAAIRKATGADKLTLASYTLLMGRPPLQAGPVNGALPVSAAQRLKRFEGAPALGASLGSRLAFQGRIRDDETHFSDELRALTVLYRYKSGADLSHAAPIFALAEKDPAQLDSVDDALRISMLDTRQPPLPRIACAPWLDVALGELGQTERKGSTRATSNPRICEYLDAASPGLGDRGDDTPWCGAFVTWVLRHRYATVPEHANEVVIATPPQPGPPPVPGTLSNGFAFPATPERAANWKAWARPSGLPAPGAAESWQVTVAGAARTLHKGDVVVVDVSGNGTRHHVGFVFAVVGTTLWMLGGNQFGGTRVSLTPWRVDSLC